MTDRASRSNRDKVLVPSSLPLSSRRIVHSRTSRIDSRQAEIVLKRVRAGRRIVPNIDSAGCGIIDGNLHGRVSDDDVPTYEVSLSAEENDPIHISHDGVFHDDVVVGVSPNNTDAEVVALACVSVSTQPVRTEPVAARAAR